MREVQEKLLPGELGVSPRVFLFILPQEWGPATVLSVKVFGVFR